MTTTNASVIKPILEALFEGPFVQQFDDERPIDRLWEVILADESYDGTTTERLDPNATNKLIAFADGSVLHLVNDYGRVRFVESSV